MISCALHGARPQPEAAASDRMLLLGGMVGFFGIVSFGIASGMSPLLSLGFFTLFLIFALATSRIHAALGPVAVDLFYRGPDLLIPQLTGTARYRPRELTALAVHHWYNRYYGTHPMPHEVDAFKLADATGMRKSYVSWVVMLGALAGSIACCFIMVAITYHLGADTSKVVSNAYVNLGRESFYQLTPWLTTPAEPNRQTLIGIITGLSVTFVLMTIRRGFIGWPFHPTGYALAATWLMDMYWLSLIIAWFTKLILLRYGGLRVYNRALSFFYGLILGDAVIGSLWGIIGVALNLKTYNIWLWH